MRGSRVSMNVVKRVILMAVILVSCVGCDQATKSIAKSIIPETESWSYLGDTVRLQVVYNRGAFLSLGSSLPEAWRFGLFSIGVGCLLVGVLTYAVLSRPGHPSSVALWHCFSPAALAISSTVSPPADLSWISSTSASALCAQASSMLRMLPLQLVPSFFSQPRYGANRPNSRAVIGRRRVV